MPAAALFERLIQPRVALALAPPDMNLELLDGPERLSLGARTIWRVRRWGIAQQLVHEVTALEENALIVQEQREGPLRRFRHEQRLSARDGGTALCDRIEIEGPGGLLGLFMSEGRIQQDFAALLEYRDGKLRELTTDR
jgi:ligand-binding SRPBCC domain-containing protein